MKVKQELEGGQETVAEVQKAEGICSGRVVGEMKVGGFKIYFVGRIYRNY